jgi:hypothetical protein
MKKVWTVLLSIVLFSPSYGQYAEFGILAGASNYHGDLAQEIVLGESHFAGGIMYRHNFNPTWAGRISAMYGTISGTDDNFDEYYYRNLSFFSDIIEFNAMMEFNYKPFHTGKFRKEITTYLYSGISAFHFNPKTEVDGNVLELRPLKTEGENSDYSQFQIAIPMGIGVKYPLSKNWIVGLELGFRRTFTDYLDDVSTVYPVYPPNSGGTSRQLSDRSWERPDVGPQGLAQPGDTRGNPELNDWYMFSSLTISYRFTPIICWPTKRLPGRYD